MPKIIRGFGPPGTGKSSWLATEVIPDMIGRFGRDKVMVTSFSKAAAVEIAGKPSRKTGRPIDINPENIGTFHSICYRALGNPTIVEESPKHLAEWNMAYHGMRITGGKADIEDGLSGSSGKEPGDKLLHLYNLTRARMIDKALWSQYMRPFVKAWTEFKRDHRIMDYADLIEEARYRFPVAPGQPDAIIGDEGQDFTPAQLALFRQWSQGCKVSYLVGDDDQTIFSFSGADPRAFLDTSGLSTEKIVLSQSYRLPRAVYDRALRAVKRIRFREEKLYQPKAMDGWVREHRASYKTLQDHFDMVSDVLRQHKSLMILASCGYMLKPIEVMLRSHGVAFHNPYKPSRGDWNPLSRSSTKIMPADLLEAFLSSGDDGAYWTVGQFVKWAKFIRVGVSGLVFKKGKAGISFLEEAVKKNADGLGSTRDVLCDILDVDAVKPALDRNLDWFVENVHASRVQGLQYPLKVLKTYGRGALTETPRCVIGTIHSVKGAESDVVMLAPDISFEAQRDIDRRGQDAVDAAWRLFYVGMTRSKEGLVLLSPATPKYRVQTSLFMEL
jgi:superfamily I DNA/RNA helicase